MSCVVIVSLKRPKYISFYLKMAMDSRIIDKKDVILLKVNEDDLMSFLVDTDINDAGDYDWRLPDLAEAIINIIPEYVFADYKDSQTSLVEMVARLREAAKSIYKIPEYRLMRDFCLNNDQQAAKELKESGYMNRGEFGELLLHLLLREFNGTGISAILGVEETE